MLTPAKSELDRIHRRNVPQSEMFHRKARWQDKAYTQSIPHTSKNHTAHWKSLLWSITHGTSNALEITPRPPSSSQQVLCHCRWNCQFDHWQAVRLLIWPAGLLSLSAAGLTDLGLVVVPSVGPSPRVEVSKADGVPATLVAWAHPMEDTQVVDRPAPPLNFLVVGPTMMPLHLK